eukprot:583622-Amorphochlora_amoeboformis.AAC.1
MKLEGVGLCSSSLLSFSKRRGYAACQATKDPKAVHGSRFSRVVESGCSSSWVSCSWYEGMSASRVKTRVDNPGFFGLLIVVETGQTNSRHGALLKGLVSYESAMIPLSKYL